jgi:polyhydroxyalkanoate synthesis repressor PhaR
MTHMEATVRLIKKYPNRRLYDTKTSSYITLAEVKQLVVDHEEFQVVDAKSSQDITRAILMQIILEEESGISPLFTSPMLSQMIRSYGNTMQGFMGNYLEQSMLCFVDLQKKMQEQGQQGLGNEKMANPELWKQFFSAQGPALQGLMGNYLEQSSQMFMEMQNQMQKQARSMFGGFQFPYGSEGEASAAEAKAKPATKSKE